MRMWKKNLIAGAVLVTVCAGIYVNWLYTEDQATANLTDTLNEQKILSTDMLVMNDGTTLSSHTDANGATTLTDYFAAVRLSRQESFRYSGTQGRKAMPSSRISMPKTPCKTAPI